MLIRDLDKIGLAHFGCDSFRDGYDRCRSSRVNVDRRHLSNQPTSTLCVDLPSIDLDRDSSRENEENVVVLFSCTMNGTAGSCRAMLATSANFVANSSEFSTILCCRKLSTSRRRPSGPAN